VQCPPRPRAVASGFWLPPIGPIKDSHLLSFIHVQRTAGEALQALGGSRGRRERARVPSTAGEPSRLAERERASPRLWRSRRPLRRPEPAEGGSRRSAAAAVARRCDRPAVRPNLGFGRDGPSENRQDADVSRVFSTARRRRGR
jgi:hypothetical protein